MKRAAPRNKYHARPTVVDGIRFHSAGEARRYQELRLLEKAGQIVGLVRQPKYPLAAHNAMTGRHEVIGYYIADFQYLENGEPVIEDYKGFCTPFARWKMAHYEAQSGIKIRLTGKR